MMRLVEYVKLHNLHSEDVARWCNPPVTKQAAACWINGRSIPAPCHMAYIYRQTRGQVAPNDFYSLPKLPEGIAIGGAATK